MDPLQQTALIRICWRAMSDEAYPRALVEAALRQSVRAQHWVLDACAELGFEHVHVQPPRRADELGTSRNPYTVWSTEGPPTLLVSYYLGVMNTGVELALVHGRRPDGRQWTLAEFEPAYQQVLQAAHKASS